MIGSSHMGELRKLVMNYEKVYVHEITPTSGSAQTLMNASQYIEDDFVVLFGDCLVRKEDLNKLLDSPINTILVDKARDDVKNHIIAKVEDGKLVEMIGYPRGIQ